MTLRELRLEAGMTQGDFAKKFEIPKKTVENWDQGVTKCPSYLEKLIAEKLEQIIESRKGYFMDRMKYKWLKEFKSSSELPSDALYYSIEHLGRGRNIISWLNLYNKDFELIDQFKYGHLSTGLQRIVLAENKNDISLMAYTLKDLENGFFEVIKTKDTEKALELISNSLTK